MQPPKNVEDYSQCVRLDKKAGILWVFCVECNAWHQAAIQARCNVLFRQKYVGPAIIDADELTYVCGICECDIGYLLNDENRQWLKKKVKGLQ